MVGYSELEELKEPIECEELLPDVTIPRIEEIRRLEALEQKVRGIGKKIGGIYK
ncbi:MAG: hypothetical protein ACLSIL_16020 [Enterococcus casseliflavus]